MALPFGKKHLSIQAPTMQTPFRRNVMQNVRTLHRRDPNVGIVVICLVSLLLLASFISIKLLLLPILGLYFVLRGINDRNERLLIPGGLLSGGGLGLLLVALPYYPITSDIAGSMFLFGCALGWFSISVLSNLFTCRTQWWPIIPGMMITFTGLVLII